VLSPPTRIFTLVVLGLLFLFFHAVFLYIFGSFVFLSPFYLFVVVLNDRFVFLSFPLLDNGDHFFLGLFSILLFGDVLIIGKARGLMLAVKHLLLQVDALEVDRQLAYFPPSE
jgi:uncharacterized membrane protein YjdF